MSRYLSPSLLALSLGAAALLSVAPLHAQERAVSEAQRQVADKVAQAGVPLSELAPNAPDSHTVQKGDTLWSLSKLFLTSPWRWPELWGMNKASVRNPHLIYPGQVLVLERTADGRAVLRVGKSVGGGVGGVGGNMAEPGVTKLSPAARAEPLNNGAIASVPMSIIGPFLNEAVIFEDRELDNAPRVVATQAGRMLVSRGELAYVRGDIGAARNWQLFRAPRPLTDPVSKQVLGYEARHVGVAEVVQRGENAVSSAVAEGKNVVVPHTIRITSLREEADVGGLAPLPSKESEAFAPHAPAQPIEGRVASLYGDSRIAGQHNIVVINKGRQDGMERGHVLALWSRGQMKVDTTDKAVLALPDERTGQLFVFRVFERMSYALILQAEQPVQTGDRFTQP